MIVKSNIGTARNKGEFWARTNMNWEEIHKLEEVLQVAGQGGGDLLGEEELKFALRIARKLRSVMTPTKLKPTLNVKENSYG